MGIRICGRGSQKIYTLMLLFPLPPQTLDSFALLAPRGEMIYVGNRKAATGYFAHLGYECPPETNPAECEFSEKKYQPNYNYYK